MRRTACSVLVVVTLLAGCSDDGGGGSDEVDTGAMLAALADEVIVPAYEDLDAAFDALARSLDELCTSPDTAALEAARAAWRELAVAWERTRAGGVGPAMDRRLAASIGFVGRAGAVDELLAGDDPVDVEALRDAGAAVKGIAAIEVALFGEGSDQLATPAGARRCTYLQSVTELGAEAAGEVLSDWQEGYRDDFVEGMDGAPQASLDLLVNELIFRATEVDDQGLRALVEAESADELRANRADGPAAVHLGELRANLEGVTEAVDGGAEGLRLVDLVQERSPDTAERLQRTLDTAVEAMAPLPDSVTESFGDPEAVADAQAAVEALKVLLGTEVASQLGVTISFSDAGRRLVRLTRLAGPLGAVAIATVAAVALTRSPGPAADEPVAADGPAPIEVASDAPRFSSLSELVAASDVVVRAEVRATERGRTFGNPGGASIESRLVTIVVADVLVGAATPGQALLVEEEGWLDDGTPLVVDGAPPSAEGDDAVWFLADHGDANGPRTVVVNAQGRYLVDGGRLEGAALDDALIASIEALGPERLARQIAALPG